MERESKLYIKTTNSQSEAEISGTQAEIMFNWAALTNQICRKLHLHPAQLSLMLPGLLGNYQHTIRQAVEVDLTAVRNRQREGQP